MPFYLIQGTFHVKGASPDGDSIRFKANDLGHWAKINAPGRIVKIKALGRVQLRIEAIDTLETHFENLHQPLALAEEATVALLAKLNITGVQWNSSHTIITEANDGTPGYILTRAAEKNGRPVSFVFAGEPPQPDGASVNLTPQWLRDSVNYQQLLDGLAYPTYYEGLFYDLRNELTSAVKQARVANKKIWAVDKTQSGVTIQNLSTITQNEVILPKLFRRLVEFLRSAPPGAPTNLSNFSTMLAQEQVTVLPQVQQTHFDTVVDVTGNTVRLTHAPENLIFAG